jgi:hypothetical protein
MVCLNVEAMVALLCLSFKHHVVMPDVQQCCNASTAHCNHGMRARHLIATCAPVIAVAIAGSSNSSKGVTFKAPLEDDDDDDDDDCLEAHQPPGAAGNGLQLYNGSSFFQQQQQSSSGACSMQTSATFPQHPSSTLFVAGGGTSTAAYGSAAAKSSASPGISSSSMRHPVQAVLEARTKQLQAGALLAADRQQRRLRQQIQGVEQQLVEHLQEVQQQLAHKRVSCLSMCSAVDAPLVVRACPDQVRAHTCAQQQNQCPNIAKPVLCCRAHRCSDVLPFCYWLSQCTRLPTDF